MKVYNNKRQANHQTARRSPHRHSLSAGIFLYRLLVIISASALIISYLAAFISPKALYFPIFFGIYSTPIFLINLLLIVIGILKRDNYTFLAIVVAIPFLLISDNFFKIGHQEQSVNGEKIKMMTYNVGKFNSGTDKDSFSKTLENILEFVEDEGCGIVCLQEFRINDTSKIRSLFQDYPYVHYAGFKDSEVGNFGNLTLSRYPIIRSGEIKFNKSTNLCNYDDIILPLDTIRLFNCHLESYSISFTSIFKKINTSGDIPEEFIQLHGKIGEKTLTRMTQVESINEMVNECGYESILCGDFNEPPTSFGYHSLSRNHKDTFAESGSGFSGTYSTFWPMLRIDYILIPEDYTSTEHIVKRPRYSDHYPVIATFANNQGQL